MLKRLSRSRDPTPSHCECMTCFESKYPNPLEKFKRKCYCGHGFLSMSCYASRYDCCIHCSGDTITAAEPVSKGRKKKKKSRDAAVETATAGKNYILCMHLYLVLI